MNFFLRGLTPTPVDFNYYRSPQYRGQSSNCVNIDITDENNYPPLLYVFSRYILVQSSRKMVSSEGWVVTAVVVWEEEDELNREERADRKSNIETPVSGSHTMY